MPSFDIVSEVDSMEVSNAVHQAQKELANRFDFKGIKAEISLDKDAIHLFSEDKHKLQPLVELVIGKLAKRLSSLKNVTQGEPTISPTGQARQTITIKQGLEPEMAKKIAKVIRDKKIKVHPQVQHNTVRVSGKNRDDLQSAIQAVKEHDFPVALDFQNFRE